MYLQILINSNGRHDTMMIFLKDMRGFVFVNIIKKACFFEHLKMSINSEIKAINLIKIEKTLKFIKMLNERFLIKILFLKVFAQLTLFETVSHFIDLHFITQTILKTTTYKNTLALRP